MKKSLALAFIAVCSLMGVHAQTTNYALNNQLGVGKVSVFTLTELNNSSQATFQMWLKPTSASTPATLIGQDNFSIVLTAANQIQVNSGATSATITAGSSLLNAWNHLTIVVNNGSVSAYINNTKVTASGLLVPFAESANSISELGCVLASGLYGQMDEIRVWSVALEPENFFWNNTLNKFHPNYDNLVAYWKCDQNLCENLVDYKFVHHGEFDMVLRTEVTDNSAFKYRVVTGYTNLMRFTDRPNIDRDMFLMTNDLILLSAYVQQDGSVWPEYTDNSGIPTNVNYLAEFEGRTGVMDFSGSNSVLNISDPQIPFNPTSTFHQGESQTATVSAWIYIDTWKEGAEIYSNYLSASECMVIKLGSEADKEIVVDLCGTIGSLKGVLQTGKWQYLGVYLSPLKGQVSSILFQPMQIAVGEYNASGEFESNVFSRFSSPAVTFSGNDMTIANVPTFANSTLKIGNNFDGKMDEIMVWSSNRSGSISNDATQGFEWGSGVWNDIFLMAYWKGDDPENIGKDSRSYLAAIDFIRGYYANHRGYKIRMGLIYPNGTGWLNVLNNSTYLDNMIRDVKTMIPHFDGLDVDLEWMYSTSDWNTYNNIISRLANEVMANYPEKIFSSSLHAVSYSGFSSSLMDKVDYFTFQLYGPQTGSYTWDYYTGAYTNFKNKGFPNDKILLSYGVLLVNGSTEKGYKDLYEELGMNDQNFDPDVNTWTVSGTTWYFNGVNQTKRKQQYIIDNDVRGTMYFDMGNDQPVSDYKSLIRAQNDVIASNVDTLVTEVRMIPAAIKPVVAAKATALFSLYPQAASQGLLVSLADSSEPMVLELYSIEGIKAQQVTLTEKTTVVSISGLPAGVYLAKGRQGNKTYTVKFIL